MKTGLGPDHYAKNGFAVVENAFSAAELENIKSETAKICTGQYGPFRGLPETTPGESDEEAQRRILCVHFPHKISQPMRDTLNHPSIVNVLTQVIGPNVKCMQSMLFIKASGKPGQAWHQDEFYIPTRDRSLAGAWIALDRATVENGCLWVIPGSHRHGILWPQHQHQDSRFDCAGEAMDFPYKDDDAVPVEVEAGSVVVFNGYLLHRSLPNRAAAGFRRALVNHYMSAESLLPWHSPAPDKAGETQMGMLDFRDIVLIAGKDPYAHKGTVNVSNPHVRPSGEGGCGDPRRNLTTEKEKTLAPV